MTGYIIAGLFAGLGVLLFAQLLDWQKRAMRLYNECLAINERWKAATSYIALRAVREAIQEERGWTRQDEAELHKKAEELKEMGVSLGLEEANVVRPSNGLVH